MTLRGTWLALWLGRHENFRQSVAAALCLTTVLPLFPAQAQTGTIGALPQMIRVGSRLAATADDVSDGSSGTETQGIDHLGSDSK